jgi:hypothetical protein
LNLQKHILTFCFLIVLTTGSLSRASGSAPVIYGPEWTFTNDFFVVEKTTGPLFAKRRELMGYYKELCQSGLCKVKGRSIQFQNGLSIVISEDPGVIEIQAKPLSLQEWQEKADFVQKYVFDVMAAHDLKPHEREGAGHLNIGINYFADRPLLLRNFIVDFYNHPGLGTVLNSLSANLTDASYFADPHWKESFPNFKKVLGYLDVLLMQGTEISVANYLLNLQGLSDSKFIALRANGIGPADQPINSETRVEVRTIRPQATMQDFISVIKIFESRLNFLEKNFFLPIALQKPRRIEDGWVALGDFADYLEEAGLRWQDYRALMPEMWRNLNTEDFVRGSGRPEILPMSCKGLF